MAQRAKVLPRLNLLEAQRDHHGLGKRSSSLEAKHSAQMYAVCSFRNVSTAS
jgi:hypothetical protein